MWKVIASRIRTQKSPSELYEESDLVIRTIRDVFSNQIDRIVVDNEAVVFARAILSIVNPPRLRVVELYTWPDVPLYQKHGVEPRRDRKRSTRRVEMANGGSLVIDLNRGAGRH